jgi:hypothetical protein
MGKCKNTVSSVISERYKQQLDTLFKINNGDLKSSLFEEIGSTDDSLN